MPTHAESVIVRCLAEAVFDRLHDYDRRLEWDPFLSEARLLDGATRAGVGVVARCTARGLLGGTWMDTVYVRFDRPRVAAVRMTAGPSILETFAASIRGDERGDGTTRVTYRFHFTARPRLARPIVEPMIGAVFARETRARLLALKAALEGER